MGPGQGSGGGTGPGDRDGGPRPRWVITGVISLALLISAVVFANNLIYLQISSGLTAFSSSSGLGLDAPVLLAIILLIVLGLGVMNENLLFAPLVAAWLMYIPSLLYFSALDWMKVFNLVVVFHDMANRLPDYVVFLNGALLVASGLLLRTHAHAHDVQENLLQRGASPDQVGAAVRGNLTFAYRIIALSTLGCLVAAGLVIIMAPAFSTLLHGSDTAYMVVSVAAGVILVALLGTFIWRAGRRIPLAGGLDPDDEH